MLSKVIIGCSALAFASAQAQAQTTVHEVATDGLAYSPNTLSDVASGDTVRLTFSTSIPHNIHSSTFDAPCSYDAAGGLSSGTYQDGEVFVWTVNSTDPALFFCSVGSHCQSGMVLAINPTDSQTLDVALTNAADATTEAPESDAVVGGMLESSDAPSGGSSGVSTSATSSDSSMTSTAESSSMTTAADSSMTSAGAAASTTAPADAGNSADGMRSSIAMLAAVVAGAIAFAL